jgi:hypothetical protein
MRPKNPLDRAGSLMFINVRGFRKRMEGRNRLVMPPISVNFGVDDRPIDPDVALLVRVSAPGG